MLVSGREQASPVIKCETFIKMWDVANVYCKYLFDYIS